MKSEDVTSEFKNSWNIHLKNTSKKFDKFLKKQCFQQICGQDV